MNSKRDLPPAVFLLSFLVIVGWLGMYLPQPPASTRWHSREKGRLSSTSPRPQVKEPSPSQPVRAIR